jgi:hypothetical protein
MRTSIFTIAFLGTVAFCFSQNYLKKIIDEMPEKPHQNITALPVKSEVPSVFGVIPANTYIGISDPAGVDSLRAVNQAYARAVLMFALQNGKGRGLTDFFHDGNGNDEASNYEELCELKVNCKLPLSQCKSDSYRLASGEILVLLTVNPDVRAKKELMVFNGNIEVYSKEIASEAVNRSISRLMIDYRLAFKPSGLNLTENYRSHADSRGRRNIESRFDDTFSDFEKYRYFYLPNDSTDQELSESPGAPVYHGLWYALLTDLFRQISKQYLNEQVRVKKVGDKFNANLISLNRETGTFNLRVDIQDLILKNNSLYVLLKQ